MTLTTISEIMPCGKNKNSMKTPIFKKFNLTMALQWLIFLPIILPLCVIFGAFQGVVGMVEKMAQRMWIDLEL